MTLTLVTPPAVEPLSVAQAAAHLRLAEGDDDAMVSALILAARQHLDGATGVLGRCLITQQWSWQTEVLRPCGLRLPLLPVLSVDTVTFTDSDGVSQVLAADQYRVIGDLLLPAHGAVWPAVQRSPGAVQVIFTTGYGDTADTVPAPIRQAMLLLIGHWYDNRDAVNVGNIVTSFPLAVDALLSPFRVIRFG